jgi:hypothetical protein
MKCLLFPVSSRFPPVSSSFLPTIQNFREFYNSRYEIRNNEQKLTYATETPVHKPLLSVLYPLVESKNTLWVHSVSLSVASFIRRDRSDHTNYSFCHNWRTAERIFIKFSMDVMPLKATSNLYFLISYNR